MFTMTTLYNQTIMHSVLSFRADEERPYRALPIVSTDIADLPAAARRRRGEGAPPYRNGIRYFKQILAIGGSPTGGRETPLPALPIVGTGVADLPSGARRR